MRRSWSSLDLIRIPREFVEKARARARKRQRNLPHYVRRSLGPKCKICFRNLKEGQEAYMMYRPWSQNRDICDVYHKECIESPGTEDEKVYVERLKKADRQYLMRKLSRILDREMDRRAEKLLVS